MLLLTLLSAHLCPSFWALSALAGTDSKIVLWTSLCRRKGNPHTTSYPFSVRFVPLLPPVAVDWAPSVPSLQSVDYKGMSANPAFQRYAELAIQLQRVELLSLSREEKLAFFINIYNALVIHGYLRLGAPTNMWQRYRVGPGPHSLPHHIVSTPASVFEHDCKVILTPCLSFYFL